VDSDLNSNKPNFKSNRSNELADKLKSIPCQRKDLI